MAQSIKEIYQEIILATDAENHLSGLDVVAGEQMKTFVSNTSASKVSIWRLWCFIVAFRTWTLQKTDDIFRVEMELFAKEKQPTTYLWIQQKTLNFLFGKPLVWDDVLKEYIQKLEVTDDEELLKVVKHCAITKTSEGLRIKIAGDVGGIPTILPNAQSMAVGVFLDEYLATFTKFEIVNNIADKLKFEVDVYVNPLVIDLSTGELHNEPGVKPAEIAIYDYLFNLGFNGRFTNTFLIDHIQAAEGITNAITKVLQHRYLGFPYADVPVSVVADAGHFIFEFLTINYKAAEV